MARKWDMEAYQRLASVKYQAGTLMVQFEDGSLANLAATRALPPGSRGADWSRISFNPYEILVPTAAGEIEIPWSTIRVLTDWDYRAHLAAAAEEQARRIGERIRELRMSRNLTSKELAARAGIPPQSLSRIERGRHHVVFTTLQRILAAMGCSLNDLMIESSPVDNIRLLAADEAAVQTVRGQYQCRYMK